MLNLCLEPLPPIVEPIDLHLKPLCGTFMSNLGKPEPLWPLCETWQLLRVELNLYVEPRGI